MKLWQFLVIIVIVVAVYTIIFYSFPYIHTSQNLFVMEIVISSTDNTHSYTIILLHPPPLLVLGFCYQFPISCILIQEYSYHFNTAVLVHHSILLHAMSSLLTIYYSKTSPLHTCRYTQSFSLGRRGGGGGDPEAIYNLCLILRTMLWKSCKNLQAEIWLVYREN